jgi:hypothetical protein
MPVQILNRAQAFQPGFQLWVVSDEQNNPIINKMDWYAHFQLTKMNKKKPESLSPQLKFIMSENNMPDFHETPKDPSPTMVACSRFLPAKQLVIVPFQQRAKDWVERIYNVWLGLEKPTLRVFLPKELSTDSWAQFWPGESHDDIQLIN